MPKLRPTAEQQANASFRVECERQALLLGFPPTAIPKRTGIPESTYFKRKKDPGMLRLSELRQIAQRLELADWQVCAIVGVPYRGAK